MRDNNLFDAFSSDFENGLDLNFKKNNGIFYTDADLAEAMLDFLDIPKGASIIDPCCGTGVFLRLLKEKGRKNVYGTDFDQRTVDMCKELSGCKNVYCVDTLGNDKEEVFKKINHNQFDYVIGNPPYAPITGETNMHSSEAFKTKVKNAGNNLFVAAIYRAFDLAKENGYVSIIVPKNLLHISAYKDLRRILINEKRLVSIVELGIHFKAVRGEQIILTFQNKYFKDNRVRLYTYNKGTISFMSEVKQDDYTDEIIVFTGNAEVPIYNKLKSSYNQLGDICVENIHRGHDKSSDAIKGKQIRKFGFKNRNIPHSGNQIFVQNIFSAEAGITASFAGNLKSGETVTIVKMKDENMCKYILGLLHSRICNYFLIRFGFNNSRLTIHTDAKYLNEIPIVIDDAAMNIVIEIVNKMEAVSYMSDEWFELNEKLNDEVYRIYGIYDADREYIENEMRKISASKWYGCSNVCTA